MDTNSNLGRHFLDTNCALRASGPGKRATTMQSSNQETVCLQRLCFRGIYFPMMGRLAWLKVIAQNRRTIFKLVWEALRGHQTRSQSSDAPNLLPAVMVSSVPAEIATLEVES